MLVKNLGNYSMINLENYNALNKFKNTDKRKIHFLNFITGYRTFF